MNDALPPLGKITPDFFDRVIYPHLGADRKDVLVKPRHGVDFGVIDLDDQVMVLSTDPFYIARELGIQKAAWFAVHIIASDVAVSGIAPTHLSIDLNLPPEMTEEELADMWEVVHAECEILGISVVTGHTARYAGCSYPMVGGATIIGIGPREKLIIPKPSPGDHILVSKGPAIEASGLMATYFPDFLKERFGSNLVREAQDLYYQMSTVKDALTAARAGGITAMHDATECGVLGGLYEMARSSGVGLRIDLDRLVLQDAVLKTCECFGMDPFISISEGTLLATVKPDRSENVLKALESENISASVIGSVTDFHEGLTYSRSGTTYPLEHPKTDPFWSSFESYLQKRG